MKLKPGLDVFRPGHETDRASSRAPVARDVQNLNVLLNTN